MLHQFCRHIRPIVCVALTLLVGVLAILGIDGSKAQPKTATQLSGVGVPASEAEAKNIDTAAKDIQREYERILNRVRFDRNQDACEADLLDMRSMYVRLANTAPQVLLDTGLPYAAHQLTGIRVDWTCHMAAKADRSFSFGAKSAAVQDVENLGLTALITAHNGQVDGCVSVLGDYLEAYEKLTVPEGIIVEYNDFLPPRAVVSDDRSSLMWCDPYKTQDHVVELDRMSV